MSKIPLPKIEVDFSRDSYKKRQYEWCEYLYSQINTVIGENGTLTVIDVPVLGCMDETACNYNAAAVKRVLCPSITNLSTHGACSG